MSVPKIFGQSLCDETKLAGLHESQGMDTAPSFANSLNAATAAITADPNFTAALVAAITSVMGSSRPNTNATNNKTGDDKCNNNAWDITSVVSRWFSSETGLDYCFRIQDRYRFWVACKDLNNIDVSHYIIVFTVWNWYLNNASCF